MKYNTYILCTLIKQINIVEMIKSQISRADKPEDKTESRILIFGKHFSSS